MSIKKVWIEDGCIACGNCEGVCPEVFELEETSQVIAGADFEAHETKIRQAAEECPVQVIKFEE